MRIYNDYQVKKMHSKDKIPSLVPIHIGSASIINNNPPNTTDTASRNIIRVTLNFGQFIAALLLLRLSYGSL
jgi:hypothetical protein